ncbi:DUF2029 domain-containing protein [bacterium]|nr:DUF2029 domain-containing protein [bacterium]
MAADGTAQNAPYSKALKQAFWLTLFSLLCANQTLKWGLGLVGPTYNEAALRLAAGISPYLPPSDSSYIDWFQYPPFCAWIYWPLTQLPPVWHGFVWMTVNAFFFWFGISRWQVLRRADKKNFKWLLLFILLCGMELEGSIRSRQINPLFLGCILLGVRDYFERRNWGAATWLMIGTGIKVLPILFAVLLLFPVRRRFWMACVCMGLAVVVLPCLTLGTQGISLFFEWVNHLLNNVAPTFGQGDIASALNKFDVPKPLALLVRHVILTTSAVVLVVMRLRADKEFPWEVWISIGLTAILLCSPKTEDQTFVLFAPLCLFFGKYARAHFQKGNYVPLAGYVIAVLFVSGMHNDLFFPRLIWPALRYNLWLKPYGTLVAWVWLIVPQIMRLPFPRFSYFTTPK